MWTKLNMSEGEGPCMWGHVWWIYPFLVDWQTHTTENITFTASLPVGSNKMVKRISSLEKPFRSNIHSWPFQWATITTMPNWCRCSINYIVNKEENPDDKWWRDLTLEPWAIGKKTGSNWQRMKGFGSITYLEVLRNDTSVMSAYSLI